MCINRTLLWNTPPLLFGLTAIHSEDGQPRDLVKVNSNWCCIIAKNKINTKNSKHLTGNKVECYLMKPDILFY
jgi:hypothetical protein